MEKRLQQIREKQKRRRELLAKQVSFKSKKQLLKILQQPTVTVSVPVVQPKNRPMSGCNTIAFILLTVKSINVLYK